MNIQNAMTLATQKAWSPFNSNQATFGTPSNATMFAEFNSAILFNTNREDFPFQDNTSQITTESGTNSYMLNASVIENMYVEGDLEYLERITKNNFLPPKTGKPEKWWPEYSFNVLQAHFYPTPDDVYTIQIENQVNDFVLGADGTTKQVFDSADDELNLPENMQRIFWECIILRAMQTGMKDNTDENYQPIIDEYNDAWRSFINKSQPVKVEKRILM